MSENEVRDLLRDVTPDPPHPIDPDRVATTVRHRRQVRTGGVVAAVAAFGVAGALWWPIGSTVPVAVDSAGVATSSGSTARASVTPGGDEPAVRVRPQVSPCSTVGHWEPATMRFRGGDFGDSRSAGEGLVVADLGEQVGQVDCSAFSVDSALTREPTRVYSYAGYDPRCVVAVRRALIPEGLVGEVLTFWAADTRGLDCAAQQQAPGSGGYRVALFIHCGVRDARVNGQRWMADPPLRLNGSPPPGWGANEAPGLFVIDPSQTSATFHADSGKTAHFRPARPDDRVEMCD